MKARWTIDGPVWTLDLRLEPGDPVTGPPQMAGRLSLLAREFRIRLPRPIEQPHPDLMAVVAYLAVKPWVGKRLTLTAFPGISRELAEVLSKLDGNEVGPIDVGLKPRRAGRRPVLSYSSGADSIASGEVLSADTPHVHWRRIPHYRVADRHTSYRADALERLARQATHRGRHVEVVKGDFEYLCHPYPTLPNWFAIATGCFLLADELDAGAIALGGTLETFYMDMGRHWRGAQRGGYGELAEVLGLPMLRPMLGVTEIGTMRLAMESQLADLSRSCMLGSLTEPCHKCAKCIRKELTVAVLAGETELPTRLQSLEPSVPGLMSLSGDPPYYMQAQLEFALSRLNLPPGPFRDLYERLGRPEPEGTDWMRRRFAPALDVGVPLPFREEVGERLAARIPEMTESDVEVSQQFRR